MSTNNGTKKSNDKVMRGDIWVMLSQHPNTTSANKSLQKGTRPVLVLQNDTGNEYSPTTIVASLTTVFKKMYLPTHVKLTPDAQNKLHSTSVALMEQIQTVDKKLLLTKVGSVCSETMTRDVQRALLVSLGVIGLEDSI